MKINTKCDIFFTDQGNKICQKKQIVRKTGVRINRFGLYLTLLLFQNIAMRHFRIHCNKLILTGYTQSQPSTSLVNNSPPPSGGTQGSAMCTNHDDTRHLSLKTAKKPVSVGTRKLCTQPCALLNRNSCHYSWSESRDSEGHIKVLLQRDSRRGVKRQLKDNEVLPQNLPTSVRSMTLFYMIIGHVVVGCVTDTVFAEYRGCDSGVVINWDSRTSTDTIGCVGNWLNKAVLVVIECSQ